MLEKWNGKPSKKGTGLEQPLAAHGHWPIDVSYINLNGTFFYLCGVLDGFSRAPIHWDLRASMTDAEIEIILRRARGKHPEARPRIISDNGTQFIAGDFKEFIHRRYDPCADVAVLSAIERENRAPAQID
ncbi:MAG: transposase family protein [Bryobacteraceae bacterium]